MDATGVPRCRHSRGPCFSPSAVWSRVGPSAFAAGLTCERLPAEPSAHQPQELVCLSFSVLGTEPRALSVLGKRSTAPGRGPRTSDVKYTDRKCPDLQGQPLGFLEQNFLTLILHKGLKLCGSGCVLAVTSLLPLPLWGHICSGSDCEVTACLQLFALVAFPPVAHVGPLVTVWDVWMSLWEAREPNLHHVVPQPTLPSTSQPAVDGSPMLLLKHFSFLCMIQE